MGLPSDRLLSVWREALSLGWPVAAQQTLNTLMRTVDVLVTGFFSPAAVAAIGLADLYARFPLRIGMGLGSGAIALSSQETGRAATATRDRAVAQALLLGALAGLPIAAVGLLGSDALLAVLGAGSSIVALGATYLAIVLAAAPFRIVGFVGARALQGTGDTRTPMLVNLVTTGLNIVLTLELGLGLVLVAPLGIVGVGVATAISRVLEAVLVVGAIASRRTEPGLVRPRDPLLTRQLLAVSVPDVAGGLSSELARFPFNAVVLLFGTEVTAAYHVANRVYQQVAAPFFRAFRTVASVLVGQSLGEGRADDARFAALAVAGLSLAAMTGIGVALYAFAEPVTTLFTRDAATVARAVPFNRAFAVSLVFVGIYFPLAGALTGAGDTRTPFWAGVVGSWVFALGASYVLAVPLGLGLAGIAVGIVLSWAARATVVGAGLQWGDWADLAARMMEAREASGGEG